MKRLLWLGVGLAVGALVFRAVSRRAQSYTPSGLAAAARGSGRHLVDSVRDFVDDVRDGMREREQELQSAIRDGVDLGDEFDDLDKPGDDRGLAVGNPPEGYTR